MDTAYFGQLLLSLVFFTPGVVLFAGLALVGVLMVLEKTALRAQPLRSVGPQGRLSAVNPGPGPIVHAFKDSIAPATSDAEPRRHSAHSTANPWS